MIKFVGTVSTPANSTRRILLSVKEFEMEDIVDALEEQGININTTEGDEIILTDDPDTISIEFDMNTCKLYLERNDD